MDFTDTIRRITTAAALLRPAAVGKFAWTEPLGTAAACCAGQHWLRLAGFKVRAISRAKRESNSRVGHGGFPRICFLRAIRHPRSMAAILLYDVHPGPL